MKKVLAGITLLFLVLFALLVLVLSIPIMIALSLTQNNYITNLWLSLDQHLNAMLCGDKDEYLSSRIGKIMHYGAPCSPSFERFVARPLFWLLHWVDHNHCYKYIDWTEGWGKYKKGRKQLITPPL